MKGGDAPPPPFESARGLPSPQGRARDFFRRIADGNEFAPTLAARAPSPRSSRGEGWGEGLFRHHRSCGESPFLPLQKAIWPLSPTGGAVKTIDLPLSFICPSFMLPALIFS